MSDRELLSDGIISSVNKNKHFKHKRANTNLQISQYSLFSRVSEPADACNTAIHILYEDSPGTSSLCVFTAVQQATQVIIKGEIFFICSRNQAKIYKGVFHPTSNRSHRVFWCFSRSQEPTQTCRSWLLAANLLQVHLKPHQVGTKSLLKFDVRF